MSLLMPFDTKIIINFELNIQGRSSGEMLGQVDIDFKGSPGLWATTVATDCLTRLMEHLKS